MEPLILLDVDGVLNRLNHRPSRRARRTWIRTEGVVDGETYPLMLNPLHGAQLLALAEDTGAQLVWATTWEHDANREIAPRVGLPTLPVIRVDRANQHLGSSVPGVNRKTPYVASWVGRGRPFVWFDDQTTAADQAYLEERCGPCRLIYVDPWLGLDTLNICDAADWLASVLAGGCEQ